MISSSLADDADFPSLTILRRRGGIVAQHSDPLCAARLPHFRCHCFPKDPREGLVGVGAADLIYRAGLKPCVWFHPGAISLMKGSQFSSGPRENHFILVQNSPAGGRVQRFTITELLHDTLM